MNPAFETAFAETLATVEQSTAQSVASVAYGSDLDCADDLASNCAEVDGASRRAVAQAVIRRFTTPRGALLDDADYGTDVRSYLNAALTNEQLRSIEAQLQGEARKDDRVDDATISVEWNAFTGTLRISAVLLCVDPALESFAVTFDVTADGAALLESITT